MAEPIHYTGILKVLWKEVWGEALFQESSPWSYVMDNPDFFDRHNMKGILVKVMADKDKVKTVNIKMGRIRGKMAEGGKLTQSNASCPKCKSHGKSNPLTLNALVELPVKFTFIWKVTLFAIKITVRYCKACGYLYIKVAKDDNTIFEIGGEE